MLLINILQGVAVSDVRRELSFCQKTKIPILGVVENMSGFVCPHCSVSSYDGCVMNSKINYSALFSSMYINANLTVAICCQYNSKSLLFHNVSNHSSCLMSL